MSVGRRISHKGLDLKFTIDTSALVDKIKDQYKPELDNLKKLLAKRDEYICRIHRMTKDLDTTIFMFTNGLRVARKARKAFGYSEKQYMALSFMANTNMCREEYLSRFLIKIGYSKITKMELEHLLLDGRIIKLERQYYAITDKGKSVVNSIYAAYRQDLDFYIKNKKVPRKTSIRNNPNKYSEAERERRSRAYKLMMRPFWDGGYKVMPKDRDVRVKYLLKWIEKKKADGFFVDDVYMRLVEKWSGNPTPVKL